MYVCVCVCDLQPLYGEEAIEEIGAALARLRRYEQVTKNTFHLCHRFAVYLYTACCLVGVIAKSSYL